ncbi:tRNA pseudouridine(55) synthase TruB [Deinococcus detaillensis]|uniref:tRNA pseudouridine synthase B n=1 Tax=Deinococcus detaillensis TaxID=2592048 RepID=A0A553V3S6_9DEIO|nr:tRNA pseudouridine(55) synthase TruB [Deinococcus detaillensis]TSA86871.1 tRNA pseudouridine(55) synthase TruB [Deinococcus detaillensis]
MPIYVVDKPLGLTSHDVVGRARRILKTKQVGHTGTLDPLATGVLVLCVGGSTKLVQFMERDSKDYLAFISLGAATPTLDAEGPVTETAFVPELNTHAVEAVLQRFTGPQQQIPPQYSALQVGGVRAYAVARAGGQLDLPARSVTLHELKLLGIYGSLSAAPRTFCPAPDGRWNASPAGITVHLPPPLGDFPTLLVWARVGSGTYLRSLARDVGAALGVPAHLSGLIRTRAGRFELSQAAPLEQLGEATGLPDLSAIDLPILEATPEMALHLRQGKRPTDARVGRFMVLLSGALVAVVDGDGQHLKVVRAWSEEAGEGGT